MGEDIHLDPAEEKRLISMLRGIPFENFKISDYLQQEKNGKWKHNMDYEKLKSIYSQFSKIVAVTKRPSKGGDKYCFIYKMSKKLSYYLIFKLDNKPKELFNAYGFNGNIEKRFMRKYWGSFFKRIKLFCF
jgi:hypothetical protein